MFLSRPRRLSGTRSYKDVSCTLKERLSYTLQCTAVVSGSRLWTVSFSSGLYLSALVIAAFVICGAAPWVNAAFVYAAFGNAALWKQFFGSSSGERSAVECSSGDEGLWMQLRGCSSG